VRKLLKTVMQQINAARPEGAGVGGWFYLVVFTFLRLGLIFALGNYKF